MIEAFREYEIIPFCPEAPLFGTPRERISVVRVSGENRIISDETKQDVTQLLDDAIEIFIKKNKDIDAIVLKSKSPSCGYKTTPILNDKRELIEYGNGIAASIMQREYKDIKIESELSFTTELVNKN